MKYQSLNFIFQNLTEEAFDILKICFLFFEVVVPTKELVLAGKDAAAEYDELAEPQDFQDDPE